MKLKKETKENRKKAMEKAETLTRDLMQKDPSISLDKLVSITGFSEYSIKKIYMKLRRENSKPRTAGSYPSARIIQFTG